MLLIFGLKVRSRTVESGRFWCPFDQSDEGYVRRKAGRWFTLFWIPIVKVSDRGEYIECTRCRRQFATHVVDADVRITEGASPDPADGEHR